MKDNIFIRFVLRLRRIFHTYLIRFLKCKDKEVEPCMRGRTSPKELKVSTSQSFVKITKKTAKKPVREFSPKELGEVKISEMVEKITSIREAEEREEKVEVERKAIEEPLDKDTELLSPQQFTVEEEEAEDLQKKDDERELSKEVHKKVSEPKRKPYIKKAPTEEKREYEKPSTKRGVSYPKQKEKDLGKRKRRTQRKYTPVPTSEITPVKIEKKTTAEVPMRIQSPFIEMDLDAGKIFIVIPQQTLNSITMEKTHTPHQLNYRIELSGRVEEVSARILTNDQGVIKIEEKRMELEEPLRALKIIYPEELQSRPYIINHQNDFLYVFTAIGNNRGRMYPLYDKSGNVNSLPQKDVWLLLHENYKVVPSPHLYSEWFWENYQALSLKLQNIDKVIVKDKAGREKIIPCEATFSFESDNLIYDDFGEQSPIFTSNFVKLCSPRKNPSGWTVWVQNKIAGSRILTTNWIGDKPLEFKLPNDLPCDYGEFQIDVCEQNGDVNTTLFFRYFPSLRLDAPKKLIIPSKKGHKSERIKIMLYDPFRWKIKTRERVTSVAGGYEITLPPENDTAKFSILQPDNPQIEINFQVTIPRLKWRISKQKSWVDKPLQMKIDEMTREDDLHLMITTNDLRRYNMQAILEASEQKLQEYWFGSKGGFYTLLLNRFYDTIKESKDKTALVVKIHENGMKVLGKVEIIHVTKPTKITHHQIPLKEKKAFSGIMPIVTGGKGARKGKGFSREEIIRAGINISAIKRLHIPYDKRRKSFHTQNIKTLKVLVGRGG